MNNNPFQPANVAPPVLTPGGDNVDDFASAAKHPPVMMDGISPSYYDSDDSQDVADNGAPSEPVTPPIISQHLIQDAADNASFSAFDNTNNNTGNAEFLSEPTAPTQMFTPPPEMESAPTLMPDPIDVASNQLEAPQAAPNATVSQIAALADQVDSQSPVITEPENHIEPDQTPTVAAVPVQPDAPKSGKTFSISILTLIFFVLSVAGIGGAIYFFIQNNNHASELSETQAQVRELEDNLAQITGSGNKENNQYNALQDRIVELTAQNTEKQKTLDEQAKKIGDLETKNKDLEGKNTELSGKVNTINDLTDKMNKILTNCKIQDGTQSPPSCTISIPAQPAQ